MKGAQLLGYSPSYGKPLSVPQGIIGLFTRFGMDVTLAHPEGYSRTVSPWAIWLFFSSRSLTSRPSRLQAEAKENRVRVELSRKMEMPRPVRETANMVSFMADVIGIRDDMFIEEGHKYQKTFMEALDEDKKKNQKEKLFNSLLPVFTCFQLSNIVVRLAAPVLAHILVALSLIEPHAGCVKVSMYMYDRPAWTGLKYETECYFPTWINKESAPHVQALAEAHKALYGPERVGHADPDEKLDAMRLRRRPLIDKWTFSTPIEVVFIHAVDLQLFQALGQLLCLAHCLSSPL